MWAKKYPPAFLQIIILREKEFYVLFYNISEKGFFYDDVELYDDVEKIISISNISEVGGGDRSTGNR